MPRRANEDPPRKVTLSLPSSVLAQVELRLINPLTMATSYGGMSALMGSLLRRWLEEQGVVNAPITTAESAPIPQPEKETTDD